MKRRLARFLDRRTRQNPTESAPAVSLASRSTDPEIHEHMETVPGILLDVLSLQHGLKGKRVLEVGCGPGLTALGLAQKACPNLLAAFDLQFHMRETLNQLGSHPLPQALPTCLHYILTDASNLGFRDESFDLVYAWSVFEHLKEPNTVLSEIQRVLMPQGQLYIQIAPLYYSAFGHHCWEHVSEPFSHLKWDQETFRNAVFSSCSPQERIQRDWQTYEGLNRLTVGSLQKMLLQSGWILERIVLQCDDLKHTHLAGPLSHVPLQDLACVQINLVARKP